MARNQRIFLSCSLHWHRQRVFGIKFPVFFARFLRKKVGRSVPGAWCWRCQSKDLIIGEENGVFLAYFWLHGDRRKGWPGAASVPYVNLLG